MNVIDTGLPGVLMLEPTVREDERGYFFEVWQEVYHHALGVMGPFVQDNLSHSRRGVLRGLHLQWPMAQGKLVTVTFGQVFDVAVDVRRGSSTFGQWTSSVLSDTNHRQLWIPPGYAHGFAVLSDAATVQYKSTAPYVPTDELTIAWNDPTIGIAWPLTAPIMSRRDAIAPRLSEIAPDRLPTLIAVE
ncbi:MAG: dTDP-4-dehydrorhamnose 3,5-epimerase [Gemmatimonadaceae bacterium]|nr:dTDP-4-dehydrorhamnose 3,5-epimerase [Gemmatimonadaceae bacterium]